MRAVRYHAARDIRIEDVEEPDALGVHEVLIAPKLVGICGTDLHEYIAGPIVTPTEPHPLTGASNPQILGHELSADVVEVGEAVRSVRVGDRVSVMPLAYCGQCHACVRGLNHLCDRMACFGLSWAWGGLGERAVVLEHQVAVLPDSVTDEQGALIEPAAVALYGVEKGGVRPGDHVLIAGAGPIGALAVLAARAAGAGAVYLSEPNAVRAQRAGSLEADLVFDPTQVDVEAELRERTGVGVDVAIECAGNARALDDCIRATRRAGTIVQTGLHVAPATVHPMVWAERELTIVGTWCYPVYDWPRIVALVASGAFPVERVVTSRVAVEDTVTGGFDKLIDPKGSEIKVLVEVGAGG
jgi:(R,R)-butanediol dehydrogenase / meso-butanediol dehydrogenase / diacetyl reductase